MKKVFWQEQCCNEIEGKDNVILSSPTGSGKTVVFLDWALKKKERPIYITAPIKALSNQRYRELSKMGYTVGIETGDVKHVPEKCEFICCTQEIYTNKYANQEDATLIIDEFHFIFENSDRTRTYIDALRNAKAKNIFLCSATLGDLNKLKQYIDGVTNRNFYLYENKERLTELVYKKRISKTQIKNALVVTFSSKNCHKIANKISGVRSKMEKTDLQYKAENQRKFEEIKKLAVNYGIKRDRFDYMNCMRCGVAVYYGHLLPKEKIFIERLFEERLIDVVVGTDALALGLNFPVKNVVFAQLAKYYGGPISKNLFTQLAGRAGRKGFFDVGYVYYCSDFEKETREYHTEWLYEENLKNDNEDIHIMLTPIISKILKGETTVEKEAEYITNYSTEQLDIKSVLESINTKLEYIKNFNIVENEKKKFARYKDDHYYDNYYDDDYDYDEDICKFQKAIEIINNRGIQQEFIDNISAVYFDELNEVQNCEIFSSILQEKDMGHIEYTYFKGFDGLLQFRRYIINLPQKYRKKFDISKLDEEINSMDCSALNIDKIEI